MSDLALLVATARVTPNADTSAMNGQIHLLPVKTIWLLGHSIAGVCGIFLFPKIDALAVFVVFTAITICAGHSVGMHRLLIHRSFSTYRHIEHILVWLGTLVGMAGPFGMIRAHDMRDWHQRQALCPPHPSHDAGFWKDAYWQLCCEFRLSSPPRFEIEDAVKADRFYQFVERTWMWQQVLVAICLYAVGGWAWVLWGCSLRISVSLIGHWLVGHYAHQQREPRSDVSGFSVQGYNLPGLGLITFGENWHGNHHAFPHSAKLGIDQGQFDPGYVFIRAMRYAGLVWGVQTPDASGGDLERPKEVGGVAID